jgi:hypothetical protein
MSKAKTIGSVSIETQNLVNRFLECRQDQIVSYEELESIAGRSLNKMRHNIHAAMHILLRDHGRYFATVRGLGVKRCGDVETLDNSQAQSKKIRRAACRGIQIATSVEYDKLPREQQQRHQLQVAQYSMLNSVLSPKQTKVLERKIENAGLRLPCVAETLAAFLDESK